LVLLEKFARHLHSWKTPWKA